MENVKISQVCGLCAGCKFAIETTKNEFEKNQNVTLFKEIVHNKNVNSILQNMGVFFEENINNLSPKSTVIIRAHGEPKSTFDYFSQNNIFPYPADT